MVGAPGTGQAGSRAVRWRLAFLGRWEIRPLTTGVTWMPTITHGRGVVPRTQRAEPHLAETRFGVFHEKRVQKPQKKSSLVSESYVSLRFLKLLLQRSDDLLT